MDLSTSELLLAIADINEKIRQNLNDNPSILRDIKMVMSLNIPKLETEDVRYVKWPHRRQKIMSGYSKLGVRKFMRNIDMLYAINNIAYNDPHWQRYNQSI